ncbi:replicative DNA helicase [Corynebacterium mendelii]|uniref:Replicative DNA helicase n=1 Tax=Corynebacterium mendelii TaxID=2765362 RepID=A0A939DZY4_9CORY|nr:replicative DNA helicase [Corynebacterium mendelii]MBN9644364.1 replicative DNA helicase [Corynebacterium mendelii]
MTEQHAFAADLPPEEPPFDPVSAPAGRYRADRTPPHDVEAEMGVLGSMMLSPGAIVDIVGTLSEDSFYRVSHQLIYRAIVDLFANNKQVDAVLVSNRLRRNGELEQVGGPAYLHTLVESVPTSANAVYYAEIVAEKAILRGLVNAGTKVVQLGYEGLEGAEIDGVLDSAQQAVFAIGRGNKEDDYQVLGDLINPVWEELDALTRSDGMANGVSTGFKDLDKLVNGLHGGQMIIVAARPGVGKSTIAMDFMRSCSIRQNKASILFSLEMSKSEVVQRILAAEASVKLADMRSGRLTDEHWDKLAESLNHLEDAPLYISDNASMTMMDVRAKARRLAQSVDLGLIVLDYLQLMSSGKRVESRQQEVSEFSRQMKLLAKELDVPVVAISQLNRGPESRTDKKPQLADLRESGSLEQDADMVFLLYRPDSQNPNDDRAGEADVIVAKHRGGPIGTVNLAHQMHYSRFVDMAREPE